MRTITNSNSQLTLKDTYADKELFDLISQENHEAFNTLLVRHRNNIFGHAMMLLKDSNKAQDIVQDVFMYVWNNRAKLPGIDSPENYLFIIARNKIVSEFRKKILLPLEESQENFFLSEKIAPDTTMEQKQLFEIIQTAIDQMPPQRRIVFELSKKEGMKYDEIAAELSISPNTVKVHMAQAYSFIRQFLKERAPNSLILCYIINYFPFD